MADGGGGGGGGEEDDYGPNDEDEDADEVAAMQAALVASGASADSVSPSSTVNAQRPRRECQAPQELVLDLLVRLLDYP